MAELDLVNIGSQANDGTGDPLRTAFDKVNRNLEAINDELAEVAGALEGETPPEAFIIAVSDETSDLTTGTGKVAFRMPYDFVIEEVRASVTVAPVGAAILVDVNVGGQSILGTRISIDANEKTSLDATTQPVISNGAVSEDAEISIDIDQVGSDTAGKGLKVTFIGHRPGLV